MTRIWLGPFDSLVGNIPSYFILSSEIHDNSKWLRQWQIVWTNVMRGYNTYIFPRRVKYFINTIWISYPTYLFCLVQSQVQTTLINQTPHYLINPCKSFVNSLLATPLFFYVTWEQPFPNVSLNILDFTSTFAYINLFQLRSLSLAHWQF